MRRLCGVCAFLCRFLGFGGLHKELLAERVNLAGDGFEFGAEGGEVRDGFGLGVGGELEDEDSGAETERRGAIGIGEGGFDGGEGFRGEFGGLFVPVESLFAEGVFEFAGEGGAGAAPVADGVAVDLLLFGGGGDGVAGGEEGDDAMLLRGEG